MLELKIKNFRDFQKVSGLRGSWGQACYNYAMPNLDRGRSSDDVQAWPLTPERRIIRHLTLAVGIVLVIVLGVCSYLR